jgi:hypothetical protein
MPVHYVPRKLEEIRERDTFISIVGRVEAVMDNLLILSDGKSKLEIFSEESVEENKLVRVFCSRIEGGWKADVIQDLSGLDLELFKRAEEIYKKATEKPINT